MKSFLQVRITTNKRRSVSHDENGKQLGAHHSWHNRPESARLHKHKFGTETQICAIEISHLPMMITQIFLQNSSKNASTRPVRIRKLVACEFRLRFASVLPPPPGPKQLIEIRLRPNERRPSLQRRAKGMKFASGKRKIRRSRCLCWQCDLRFADTSWIPDLQLQWRPCCC